MEYVHRLKGYNDELSLEFSLNFRANRSMVAWIVMEEIEEIMVEVTRIPQEEEPWYYKKNFKPKIL